MMMNDWYNTIQHEAHFCTYTNLINFGKKTTALPREVAAPATKTNPKAMPTLGFDVTMIVENCFDY